VALHAFAWQPAMGRAGLRRDAAYLVRPDGYVALADPEARASTLTWYLDAHRAVARADPAAGAHRVA